MIALLQDPIWQFVGAVLALLAIGVTVWVYLAQRTKRRLLVEHIARMPLMAIGAKKIPGLKISIDEQSIAEATIVLVRVTNAGNASLVAADFESPVSLTFGPKARILYADVAEFSPSSLQVSVTYTGNVVQFGRQLLNPGDTFSCRILVQDSLGKYLVGGRVVGVREIETSSKPRIGPSVAIVVGMFISIASLVLAPKPDPIPLKITIEEMPYLVVALGGSLTAGVFAFLELLSRFKKIRTTMMLRRSGV